MGHGFILPVQFGIKDGAGVNLQCADQRENDLPGWVSDAIFNVHYRSDFYANLFSQLALCITKAKSRVLDDTAQGFNRIHHMSPHGYSTMYAIGVEFIT